LSGRTRGTLFVVLVACFVSRAFASLDTNKIAAIRSLTLQGLDAAYNLDFSAAEKKFDEASAIEPLHPRPLWGRVEIKFWQMIIGRRETNYDAFLAQANNVIDKAEKYVDTYGQDPDALICLGTLYGDRAFANARMKNYLRSAWDGKKSFDYFTEANKLDPNNPDAYVGLGVYHFFAAFIPKPLQWIVSILGVHSDDDLGIHELGIAAERGIYSKVEAKYYLAEMLPWYNGEFDSSETIFKGLSEHYPRNILFTFTLAAWEMRRNAIGDARERLMGILDNASAIPGLQEFTEEKLGECNFRLGNYREGLYYYKRFLLHHPDELYVGSAQYRAGLCYELLGERDSAIAFYKSAAEADPKFGDDAYCKRRAQVRLKEPMREEDLLLLRAQNYYRTSRYDSAVAMYEKLAQAPDILPLTRTEALYGLAETYFELAQYDSAILGYQAVVAMDVPADECWLLATSHYRCGICHRKLSHKDLAGEEFRKTLEFEDYDYDNWYTFRTKKETEFLKRPG
jgi:tetratricopeptide (TPR) repeat protein